MPRRVCRLARATALLLFAAQPVLAQDEGLEARRRLLLDADNPAVMVVAHRGCWRDAAENALSGIEACVRMGVDVVELDVRRTRDGALVLMHDETVDRTTNGTGRVSDLTLAEVVALRLRAGAGGQSAALTGESPPTFVEAIEAARGRVLVNLDAKADVYDDAFAELDRLSAVDLIIMKRRVSVDEPSLSRQAPFAPAPPAVEVLFTDRIYLAEASGLIRRTGARVWVNTLRPEISAGLTDVAALQDPDAVWGWLLDNGVTMIQTDEPETLVRYLEARGRRRGL